MSNKFQASLQSLEKNQVLSPLPQVKKDRVEKSKQSKSLEQMLTELKAGSEGGVATSLYLSDKVTIKLNFLAKTNGVSKSKIVDKILRQELGI